MRPLEALFQTLDSLDIKLWVEGDSLRYSAPEGVMSAALLAELKAKKTPILAFLRKGEALPKIVVNETQRYDPFPLTDIQQAFWVGQNAALDLNGEYHAYLEYEWVNLDISRLTHTWQLLVQRHEMLRAVVQPPDQQQILDSVPTYQIPVLNIADASEASKQTQLQSVRDELSHQVFDLTTWPLFDIRVTQRESNRFHVHLSLALIMLDAGSCIRLLQEWNQLYHQIGTPSLRSLPALGLSYRDYVIWEQSLQLWNWIDFRKCCHPRPRVGM